MPEIDAREALRYAVGWEWLKLYGVIVIGAVLSGIGQLLGVVRFPLTDLFGAAFGLAGTAVGTVGLVAAAYKLLAEGVGAGRADGDDRPPTDSATTDDDRSTTARERATTTSATPARDDTSGADESDAADEAATADEADAADEVAGSAELSADDAAATTDQPGEESTTVTDEPSAVGEDATTDDDGDHN